MGDSVTREILTEHFSGDDQRHTELRDEFRKVAGEDKKTAKPRTMVSSLNLVRLFLRLWVLPVVSLTPQVEEPLLQENVYRGFLQSMANA